MGTIFQSVTTSFSGSGTQPAIANFPDGTNITGATVVLQAINGTYGSNKDHMMRDIQLEISDISWSGPQVKWNVTYKLDDNSGHDMTGYVVAAVIAITG